MNTKNNQRYRDTHIKIQQVLLDMLDKKDFEKITVRDICEAAQINRSTFYAHYIDIYDLMESLEQEIELGIFERFRGSGAGIDNFHSEVYYRLMLEYVLEKQTFYRAYFNGHVKRPRMQQGFDLLCNSVFIPYFKKISGDRPESEMLYFFHFFFSGFTTVIKRWLDSGCCETPEQLSHILWQSIPSFNP